jgi:multiple sugar transport system ATP-binding protein
VPGPPIWTTDCPNRYDLHRPGGCAPTSAEIAVASDRGSGRATAGTESESTLPGICIEDVSKSYGSDGRAAVDHVSLTIEDGEFMVLVGPSGCGKTTLLKMIAGLEDVTSGTISIGDRDVTGTSPGDRNIAMVFQNYALYPHLTVRKNLGYGLRVRGEPRALIEKRVADVAQLLGLEESLDRRPGQLSGGQRQRVAMGRAIVREPAAFLMDEPLSNLDAKLRVTMRAQLSQLHERLRTTTVYVTHDQVEAMTLGERVAIIKDGRVQQVDTPQALYADPVNLFVAAFIGSPSMNLATANIVEDGISFAGYQMSIPARLLPRSAGERVIVGVRPHDLKDAAETSPATPVIDVVVSVVEELGSVTHAFFAVGARAIDPAALGSEENDGDEEFLFKEGDHAIFTASLNPVSGARPGKPLRLAVPPESLFFFDPITGDRLRPVG